MKKSIFVASLFAAAVFCGNLAYAEDSEMKTENNYATIQLSNGLKIPQFGLGTYRSSEQQAHDAVLEALKDGYRHIDTAHAYRNERGIAKAIKESGIPRSEIWITSKLWPTDYSNGNGAQSIDKMLERLGTDYVDLVYLHQPVGDYMAGYRALEEAVRQGKVRAIGLSNFDLNEEIFEDVYSKAEIKPVIVQIELNPYAQRVEFRKKWRKKILPLRAGFLSAEAEREMKLFLPIPQ